MTNRKSQNIQQEQRKRKF